MVSKCNRTEKLFQQIFSLLPSPTILMDDNGDVLQSNKSFLETFKMTAEQLHGKNFFNLIQTGEIEEEEIREYMRSGINSDRSIRFEAYVTTGIEESFWALIDARYFNFEGTNLCVTTLNDITYQKKEEENLRLSEERTRTFFNNANDLILSVTPEGKVNYANQKWMDLLGYDPGDWPLLKITDIVPQEEIAHVYSVISRAEQGEKLEFVETVFKTKDGHDIYVEGNIDGYYEYKTFIAARCIFRDITKRKLIEEIYRVLVLYSPLPIYIMQNGLFRFVNPQFQSLTGYSETELIGNPLINLVHEDDKFSFRSNTLNIHKTQEPLNQEFRIRRKNGDMRWVMETNISIPYEKGRATLGTLVDLTQRKEMETSLKTANEKLKEMDKLKDSFLSTVSHELRTPLTAIKSFTEILLTCGEDQATRKESLGIISDETDRLTRLINDFLDLSKIQAGRMQWKNQEVSLADVVKSVVSTARPLIEKEKLILSLNIESDLPYLTCDRDRMVQVITNILGNAIKFTPKGGSIIIKVWRNPIDAPVEPNYIIVSIADTGIGIASENQSKIFENFGQVGDALKDKPKGTGLGLPISKKIVENYGGNIRVESELGKGTTFYVCLPITKLSQ